MANPNWVKGMGKVPGSGRTKGKRAKVKPPDVWDVVRKVEQETGFTADPVEILLQFASGYDARMPGVPVAPQMREDAAKAVAPFVRPKLAAVTLTGEGGGPIRVDHGITRKLNEDPELLDKIEEMHIKLAEHVVDEDDEEETGDGTSVEQEGDEDDGTALD